eukprot:CAMPEP_0197529804 /NCGR_PEP_ID=MMETSP1318-20131121/29727_1 /TAXON_ID=552666 /ORGANISM="Partenskyella glossopodia, Strain RCC365" /LENGTH=162 /DNA_ID=CAMNT_0043085405 /DNA_START=59 /DNA_END=547 /DNA_ORIENTATION=-
MTLGLVSPKRTKDIVSNRKCDVIRLQRSPKIHLRRQISSPKMTYAAPVNGKVEREVVFYGDMIRMPNENFLSQIRSQHRRSDDSDGSSSTSDSDQDEYVDGEILSEKERKINPTLTSTARIALVSPINASDNKYSLTPKYNNNAQNTTNADVGEGKALIFEL